ncbi:FimV/HubP family polar landmark protein [Pseudomonas sp. Gutcm_11s]|uniref:FimV/HubP family polar landmark protein n=1 Tax=Pseudomonas sp. Gutcm_11s TaxID=3026088 RepID=UPI00235FD7B4|nr:FimV/HubP family polar landmark protein [Pseudomonas sp. Gutcm_11s]MDD0843080.1 peptidoglycan-binding protein LysM [Pseudomonas sp. Gutcm_11s]
MARIRDLLLTLASGSAFYSGLVPALGLGEINLHSALNQPLDAEIELYQIGDLGSDEIKVRLASAEEFNRAGVERYYFLNDLRFAPMLDGGRTRIRVVSSKPVREPYLNFIVEVARPGGTLLREYTVLIDPPGMTYGQQASPQAPARVERNEVAARLAAPRAVPPAIRGERYRVQRGDSLWSIAGRLQGAGATASREALMADIHALNPQAFAGGDINRLRAEAELLLPDSVAAGASPAPVSAPVMQQPVVDAPAGNVVQESVEIEQRQADAELVEVTAQNQALQDNLVALQDQLSQLQAQMAEKDRQLQQIHDELQQRREAPPAPVAESARLPVAPAPVAVEKDSGSLMMWLLGSALGLLLLAAAWLLGRRRTPAKPAEPQRRAAAPVVRPQVRVVAAAPVRAEAEPEEPPAPAPGLTPPRLPTGVADPLEGANIYIAYGRFSEAASALRKGIALQPARLDLRLRLLEVLGELGDGSAFAAQQQELQEMGASHMQVDQIRVRYAATLRQPPEQAPLADAVLQLDDVKAPVEPQDEFQLNLDDLSLDADWGLASPFKPEQPARSKAVQEPAYDPHFRSNLQQLPDVLEMDHIVEDFRQEQLLDDELTEAFASSAESDLDHLAGNREHLVKLNTALAYIEQGDIGSACDILNEVISSGDEQERQQARELLAKIA